MYHCLSTRKGLQSVCGQIHKAIILVLQRCGGSTKGNETEVRMEYSTETVCTGRLAQLNKSNRSSSNSACNAKEVVFKETM